MPKRPNRSSYGIITIGMTSVKDSYLRKEEPRGAREWPGLLRMLDRVDPGFRN